MLRAKVLDKEIQEEVKLCLIGIASFLFIIKHRTEGFMINALLVIFYEFIFLLDIMIIPSLIDSESTPEKRDASFYSCFVCFVLYGSTLFLLKSYKLPRPTGKYNVGYKDFDKEEFSTAIFYPTIDPIIRGREKGGYNLEFFRNNFWTPIKSKTKVGKYLPGFLIFLAIDFLRKVKLHVRIDAALAKINEPKYTPVIVTHGLTGDRICKKFIISIENIYIKKVKNNKNFIEVSKTT